MGSGQIEEDRRRNLLQILLRPRKMGGVRSLGAGVIGRCGYILRIRPRDSLDTECSEQMARHAAGLRSLKKSGPTQCMVKWSRPKGECWREHPAWAISVIVGIEAWIHWIGHYISYLSGYVTKCSTGSE